MVLLTVTVTVTVALPIIPKESEGDTPYYSTVIGPFKQGLTEKKRCSSPLPCRCGEGVPSPPYSLMI